MMKRLFVSLTAVLICIAALAQGQIQVNVPSVVTLDEQFSLAFSVEGEKVSDFSWPGSPDFTTQWGPQVSSSSYTSIVNGKRTHSVTYTYTFLLMPNHEGTFTIPACSAKIKGKVVKSQEVTVKVQKVRSVTSAGSSGELGASAEDLFMRLLLDKRDVVVGEPIEATLKLYKRVPVDGFDEVKFPSFDGFWSQATYSPTNIEFKRESLGEAVYDVAVLRQYKLIPQKTGELEIDPAEIVCRVQVRNGNSAPGSIFDSFFQSDYSISRKRVRTKPVSINVRALPQPQPSSFCGGVGKFSMAISLSTDSLKTHDAASLIVRVKGDGNLNLIEAPKIKFPSDFEVYDVKSTDSGSERVFEYPFIPRHHGDYTVGPVEFSYYDIQKKSYVTTSAQALSLHVRKSASPDGQTASPAGNLVSVAGKSVANLGTDIRYISTAQPSLKPKGKMLVSSPLYWVLCVLLVMGGGLAYLLTVKTRSRHADIVGERKRAASKLVRQKLSRAEKLMKQGNSAAFYEELHRALLGYVSDKFSLDACGLDKEDIASVFDSNGVDMKLSGKFMELLNTCEYIRYSPTRESGSMKSLYDSALSVISALESVSGAKTRHMGGAAVIAALMLAGGIDTYAEEMAPSWNDAVSAYSAEDYNTALSIWTQIEAQGLESPELYYNMGCAYFKSGDLAHSVLYYERALKLDPSYPDALNNLKYVNQFLQDRIDELPQFFLAAWYDAVRNRLSSDGWAVLSLVFLAVACVSVVLVFVSSRRRRRVGGLICGVAAALLFVCSLSCSLSLHKFAVDRSYAIVCAPVSVVRSSPDDNSGTELFVLHEGTKAKVIEEVGSWSNIELSDGRQGWIKNGCLEII